MSRSIKKGPFIEARLLGRIEEMNKRSEKRVVKTWSRASVIFPTFIGHTTPWRKAIVTLAPGQKIEFFEGV